MPAESIQKMVAVFDLRRQYCIGRLDKLSEHLTYVRPNGAFYFFINMSRWLNSRKMNDVEFCQKLLNEAHIGLVPGSSFG